MHSLLRIRGSRGRVLAKIGSRRWPVKTELMAWHRPAPCSGRVALLPCTGSDRPQRAPPLMRGNNASPSGVDH